jgi:hypothetical protein
MTIPENEQQHEVHRLPDERVQWGEVLFRTGRAAGSLCLCGIALWAAWDVGSSVFRSVVQKAGDALVERYDQEREEAAEGSGDSYVTDEQLCSFRWGERTGAIENLLGEATSRSAPTAERVNLTYESASDGERTTFIFEQDHLQEIIRSVEARSDSGDRIRVPGTLPFCEELSTLFSVHGVPWTTELKAWPAGPWQRLTFGTRTVRLGN